MIYLLIDFPPLDVLKLSKLRRRVSRQAKTVTVFPNLSEYILQIKTRNLRDFELALMAEPTLSQLVLVLIKVLVKLVSFVP